MTTGGVASSRACGARWAARWGVAVGVTLLLLSASIAGAAPRTDTVTLRNGDHITGEVTGMSLGSLTFKTDDAGTLEIEWDKLIRVESQRQFDVMTTDGRRGLGRLGHADSDRVLLVVGEFGSEALPFEQVTDVQPIGKSFWAKLDGSLDIGFNYTRSSGIAQLTTSSDTIYRRPAFQLEMTSSLTLTKHEGDNNRDDRGAFNLGYSHFLGRRWFVAGAGQLESNESLGLVLRSQVGGGVGMRVVNKVRAQTSIGAGLVANNEQGVDTGASQNLEGLLSFKTSYYSYDKPRTTFLASFQYYPSLSNWGRQRIQLDSSMRREIWKDFFIALNLFDTFDSRPPNPDAERNDVGVTASVGWSF
jgi:hypothetical protein